MLRLATMHSRVAQIPHQQGACQKFSTLVVLIRGVNYADMPIMQLVVQI